MRIQHKQEAMKIPHTHCGTVSICRDEVYFDFEHLMIDNEILLTHSRVFYTVRI